MTLNAYLTSAILAVILGLLIKTKLSAAPVFLGALATAIALDLAPTKGLLKGFSPVKPSWRAGSPDPTDRICSRFAAQLGVNFMPFAITLKVAPSCAFITPTGYLTNLTISGPGGCAFDDFVKIGTIMTLSVAVVTLVLAPMVFNFLKVLS